MRPGVRAVLSTAIVATAVGLATVGAAGGTPLARIVRVLVAALLGAAALAVVRRPHGRLAAGVVLTGALAAATVGGTVGFAHLRVGGWSVHAVGGLLALVGGLVVVGVLAVELIRSVHGWARLAALPIALALVAFVVYPVLTAVYATAQPHARLGSATPATRGRTYTDVRFRTADGITLSGWYLPSRDGAAVALLHGASSTRSSVLDQAVALNRHGYGVLLFDARGHGRSSGSPMDLGWYGDRDVEAAIDELTRQPHVDPGRIAVVGMSMGGEEAIGAAATDHRIRAVVAEGAENRTYADRAAWLPRSPNGWLQRGMDRLAYGLTDLLTPARPPIGLRAAAARAAPRPMLLIAGSGEEAAADAIRRASPATVQVWASHAGHTRGLATHPAAWRARVFGFLDHALAPRVRQPG
jgi:pimeloyl-ACP methyl ester carboxylesterase